MSELSDRFRRLLERSSEELYEDNRDRMATGSLLPTPNVIDERDLDLFFRGIDAGLIRVGRGGRFNTWDRPKHGGRWSLLSRSKQGGWYNAEYLPQLAAYVNAIEILGYTRERVLFELPAISLQLDLAILDDDGQVIVLGEAKRERGMLAKLAAAAVARSRRNRQATTPRSAATRVASSHGGSGRYGPGISGSSHRVPTMLTSAPSSPSPCAR